MQDQDANQTVMWREGTHRCELWHTDGGPELRGFVSDVLTCGEPVGNGTGGLLQAAKLLAAAQESMYSHSGDWPAFLFARDWFAGIAGSLWASGASHLARNSPAFASTSGAS